MPTDNVDECLGDDVHGWIYGCQGAAAQKKTAKDVVSRRSQSRTESKQPGGGLPDAISIKVPHPTPKTDKWCQQLGGGRHGVAIHESADLGVADR